MIKASNIYDRLRRTLTWYVLGKVVLALLVIAVSATSIVVTTTTYQAEVGGELNVTNSLVAVDKGFFVASSNATATATTSSSFLTIWPPVLVQPTVSSLNWSAGDTVPNFVGVFMPSGGPTAGQVAIYNDAGAADLLLDVTGYFYPV